MSYRAPVFYGNILSLVTLVVVFCLDICATFRMFLANAFPASCLFCELPRLACTTPVFPNIVNPQSQPNVFILSLLRSLLVFRKNWGQGNGLASNLMQR